MSSSVIVAINAVAICVLSVKSSTLLILSSNVSLAKLVRTFFDKVNASFDILTLKVSPSSFGLIV